MLLEPKGMNSLSLRQREMWLALALLMVGAYCLFANTFGNAWTLDDLPVIVNNPDIQSLKGFFENTYPGRPLREITYLLDHALFGLDPAGYHIQNIFWHGLNAGLLYLVVRRLGGEAPVAWTASLLFLSHPINVEVVANVSHRKDSLALVFSLLSVLAYTEAFRSAKKRYLWLAVSICLAGIAYLGKQTAAAIPLAFLAFEVAYVPSRQRWLLKYRGLCAGVFLGATATFFAWFFLRGGQTFYLAATQPLLIKMNYLSEGTAAVYFGMVLKSWAFMFLRLLLPLNLAPEYTYSVPASWGDPWVVAALGGVCLYVFLLWTSLRRWPLAFFALVWLGAFWLPVSNVWPLAYFAADRYLYIPSVGLFILVALILSRLFSGRTVSRGIVVSCLILILAVLTWQQNRVWRSPLALWSQAARVSPESTWALNNLGAAYMLQGEYARALPLFQKAAKNFNDSKTLYNLGWAYEMLGDRRNALRYYQMFLSMNEPKYQSDISSLKKRLGWR